MTVVRLSTGEILLHSPVRYSPALHREVEPLGRIKYLLAPNTAHWIFLKNWQNAVPDALTFSAPGLAGRNQVRTAGVRIDRELDDGTPAEWAEDLATVLVSAPFFCEVAIFHKRTRTLILTDIVQNLDPKMFPWPIRPLAHLLGITKPGGRAPIYLRLLLRLGGRSVQSAARRLAAFSPEKVIFAHGEWFDRQATERLRRSLHWLVPACSDGLAASKEMAGTRVVITGASSGIGRAAAMAFAEKGASVILAARRGQMLERLALECEALGGRALAVPTDVTDAEAVVCLAEKADECLGGIDVWINNAGTGVFGAYQDADIALHRRTVEVNLLGAMNGSHAVLPIFLRQKRGILINNISIGGWAPTPFAAAYTASKFGLRGFTASLRLRIVHDDRVAIVKMKPRGVLEHNLLVDRPFGVRERNGFPLQRVVKLLGAAKEARCPLNQMPVGVDPHRVHHQRERCEQFGDASSIEGRTDVRDAHGTDEIGLRGYTLNRCSADERFVLFERVKPEGRSLDDGAQNGHRKLPFQVRLR
jgi:NADP-dependent 3-hydroxy acid dehydrogenase YdfG